MQTPRHALTPRPYFLINQLQLAIVQRLEPDIAPLGITPGIARVLNAIATRPGISSSELARMLGIAPQSVKQSIHALESGGMIARSASDRDQRVQHLELTDKGREVWQGHLDALSRMYADIFRGLNKREMNTLTRLLTKAVAVARPESLVGYRSVDEAEGEASAE